MSFLKTTEKSESEVGKPIRKPVAKTKPQHPLFKWAAAEDEYDNMTQKELWKVIDKQSLNIKKTGAGRTNKVLAAEIRAALNGGGGGGGGGGFLNFLGGFSKKKVANVSMSMKELRKIISDNGLSIKTSGIGRTKQKIADDINAALGSKTVFVDTKKAQQTEEWFCKRHPVVCAGGAFLAVGVIIVAMYWGPITAAAASAKAIAGKVVGGAVTTVFWGGALALVLASAAGLYEAVRAATMKKFKQH